MNRCIFGILILIPWLLIGCADDDGKTTAVVTGKVTLDGEPFHKGSLSFVCLRSGTEFHTEPADDGSYTIEIPDVELGESFGVFIGPLIPEEVPVDANDNPLPDTPPECPSKYQEYSTSGLSAVIDQRTGNSFDFELTSK